MIGITIGDPSGIGPEITLKALKCLASYKNDFLIIGNRKLLENLQRKFVGQGFNYAKFSVINAFDDFKHKFGKPQKQCGVASFLQLDLAVHLLKVGKIKGIVTAPVSKTALSLAGFLFPGQTEYFGCEFGVKKYGMLAWSDKLKIILVTVHKPLKDVPKLITTKNVLDKIVLLNDYLVRDEKKRKPRIGVFSLNPHTFEFTCGAEAKILKAIKIAQKQGISAQGPLPADAAFSNLPIRRSRCEPSKMACQSSKIPHYTWNDPSGHLRIEYDGFVAMYHDQAMLPVKLLSQGTGVNITLGLPFTRTSPLHGVAFDIAGKGIANSEAMYNAIIVCQKLTAQTKSFL